MRTAEVLGRLSMSTDEDDVVGYLSELAGFVRPLTIGARLITRHDWGPDIGLDYPQPAEWSAIPYSRGAARVGALPNSENLGSEVKEVVVFCFPNGMPGLAVKVSSRLVSDRDVYVICAKTQIPFVALLAPTLTEEA